MRKYGGVQNARFIDEIMEAECVAKPSPERVSKWDLLLYLPLILIKLLPITLLFMAIVWGVSFLIVGV